MNKADWQPIETCPIKPFNKDELYAVASDRVLLWNGYCCVIGRYGYTKTGNGRWRDQGGFVSPTYWMPLPDRPA